MKQLEHYVNSLVPAAASLPQGEDLITFSVLINILHGECAHTFTDHENVILCHSTPPYPVWIWCKDPSHSASIAAIAACIRENFPTEQGFCCNLSVSLLEALRAQDPYFENVRSDPSLFSYRMDTILPVTHPCEGNADTAKPNEIDLLCKLWHDACLEMEGFDHNEAFCRARVLEYMEKEMLFVWRNDAGEIVAMTSRRDTAPFSKIATVYTLPQHRRKGYAMNLVHAVSSDMIRDGLTPILYTDARYPASNACYQKIGYKQVGSLCTIGRK